MKSPIKVFNTKILPVEAALIKAYRQTDGHDKAKEIPFAIRVNARKIEDN